MKVQAESLALPPGIERAEPKDNKDILQLLRDLRMTTPQGSLSYSRDPDFFKFSRIQGTIHTTFLFRNSDKSLKGLGQLSVRDCELNGRKSRIGYFSDLRIHPQLERRIKVSWRKTYLHVLSQGSQYEELGRPEFFFTAVLDENKEAQRSLVQRHSEGSSRSDIVYSPMTRYRSVLILARKPCSFSLRSNNTSQGLSLKKSLFFNYEDVRQRILPADRFTAGDHWGYLSYCKDLGRVLTLENLGRGQQLMKLALKALGRSISSDDRGSLNLNIIYLSIFSQGSFRDPKSILDIVDQGFERCIGDLPWGQRPLGILLPVMEEEQDLLRMIQNRYFCRSVPGTLYEVSGKSRKLDFSGPLEFDLSLL